MKKINRTKCILLSIFLFNASIFSLLNAQEPEDTVITDNVMVTAKRISELITESSRSIILLSQEDIKNAPVQHLQDLLSYCSGVDVLKRGPEGVQADVSIHGGTFEQSLILIDGVKVIDPQTGHNNLNLPVNLEDIERVEILKGQASSMLGPNALSGAINIVTKKVGRRNLVFNASGGEKETYSGGLSFPLPVGEINNTLSLSKSKSSGYRHNTGFDISTVYYNSALNSKAGSGNFLVGYIDKKFGANGFYSDKYPNQQEHIRTLFSAFGMHINISKLFFAPKLYLRRNKDTYLLDYSRPEFYKNDHVTNSYGAELKTSLITDYGIILLGSEFGIDDINSSSLGEHTRKKGGISVLGIFSLSNNLKITPGVFAYNYDNAGWKFWPGIDLGFSLNDEITIYGSIGKSFRLPTFTELYYSSPAQTGNQSLMPEEAESYEGGINYAGSQLSGSLGIFLRNGVNLIDWIRASSDIPWHAENISTLKTIGCDIHFSIKPDMLVKQLPIQKITLGYTYLNSDLKTGGYQSRYVLNHLKHQIISEILHQLPFAAKMNWSLRYENRLNQKGYFIADLKLMHNRKNIEFFVQATNLFNKPYSVMGIPMPGKWIIGGVKYQLNPI